jgi:hypothetical protein
LGFGWRIPIQIKDFFKLQGKDLNFKRRFGPKDLDSIYFIESVGRIEWKMDRILSRLGSISRLSFKVLKIKPRQDDV